MKNRFLTFLLLSSISLFAVEKNDIKTILPRFEEYIEQGMKDSYVPGLAIAIVYDNEVIYKKGFGTRKVGQNLKVSAKTVFQLASISKPITSTILASLVSEKSLRWDSPIHLLDPSFQLHDPWITNQLTIKDLLSHRSGLPDHAGDRLEDFGFDQEEIIKQLRLLPLKGFRSEYAYTNFGFTEAALAAAKAVGKSWQTLVTDKLVKPLQLQSTSTLYHDYINHPNHADLHMIIDGKPKAIMKRNPDAQAPAGGFSSNLDDLVKWLMLQINLGFYAGKKLISSEALKETHIPIVNATAKGEPHIYLYGLGWGMNFNANGQLVLSHSGAFRLGANTLVSLIPKEKIGLIILANAQPTGLPQALEELFYRLIENKLIHTNWLSKWNKIFDQIMTISQPLPETKNFSNSLPNQAYLGNFENPYFGSLSIFEKDGTLKLQIGKNEKSYALRHLNHDIFFFEIDTENFSGMIPIFFTIGADGQASQIFIKELTNNGFGTFKKRI